MLAWQAQSFGLKIFSQVIKKKKKKKKKKKNKKPGLKIPCGLERCSEPPTEKYQRVVFGVLLPLLLFYGFDKSLLIQSLLCDYFLT